MLCVKTLADQVLDYIRGEQITASELARRVGVKRQNIDYLCAGSVTSPRYIARLAATMGTTVESLEAGAYRHPQRSTDQDPPKVVASIAVAHPMSHRAFTLPNVISWESLMQSKELPARFVLDVPDEALAPSLQRGTSVVFESAINAAPGECVLVEDSRGDRYIRRYVQGVAGQWEAQAINPAYVSLQSERDGLKILAVMAWRAERRV